MNQHSSFSAYFKNVAMLATNGSYFLHNTDLGNGYSSTLSYKPKYYTGQSIKVNYRIRPIHLPSAVEDEVEEEEEEAGEEAGEEADEEDFNNLSNLFDLPDLNEDELEGIYFTQDDRDIGMRGGGYESDDNGRSYVHSEWTQDDNMTQQTDGDQQTDRVNTEANVDDVKVTNGNILKDIQRRYGLSFPPENQLHNARLLLILKIENAVLTIADKKLITSKYKRSYV